MGEYNFLLFFLSGGAKLLSREQCVGWLTHDIVAALWSCSRQKYLELWPAAWNEAWRSVLMLMKGSKIPRTELNTVPLYQHYSLFMPNKLQYTWRGDYCECVRPAQLPLLTEVRDPSLLEQYPRYVPHRDRARYNIILNLILSYKDMKTLYNILSPLLYGFWPPSRDEIKHYVSETATTPVLRLKIH